MRVSVVIPSYGQAQYLRDAIDSAITQTYTDTEVIVVDDGSTDGSLEIAESYGSRIKLVSQRNKGLASARNTGIMNATGEYVFMLDADDTLSPDGIEKLVALALETSADVIAPSILCYDEQRSVATPTVLMANPTFADFTVGNRLAYCALIKRSVLLETGGYSPKMDTLGGWEDLHLWYDLMRREKKLVTTPELLVTYRLKEKSMWRDAEKNKEALWAQLVKDFPETKDHVK